MNRKGYELLTYFRREIKFESEMLNARSSAFLTSQSFLVIAYVTSLVGLREDWHPLLKLVLPTSLALLGLLLAIQARPGIVAAARILVSWRRKQEDLLASDPELAKHLAIQTFDDTLEPLRRGTRFAMKTPNIFKVAWCLFATLPTVVVLVVR